MLCELAHKAPLCDGLYAANAEAKRRKLCFRSASISTAKCVSGCNLGLDVASCGSGIDVKEKQIISLFMEVNANGRFF